MHMISKFQFFQFCEFLRILLKFSNYSISFDNYFAIVAKNCQKYWEIKRSDFMGLVVEQTEPGENFTSICKNPNKNCNFYKTFLIYSRISNIDLNKD